MHMHMDMDMDMDMDMHMDRRRCTHRASACVRDAVHMDMHMHM